MPSLWQQRTTVAAAVIIILCLLNSRRRKRRRCEGRINKKCTRMGVEYSSINQEKKKSEGKKEGTVNIKETTSWKRYQRLLASKSSQGAKNTNRSAQGESSQHGEASSRNDDSPGILTPKIEIKEEIEVDEDQWKLQQQAQEEKLMEDVEWTDLSEHVKVEPKEEDEELEPFASVTIPSHPEDMFEEEY